MLVESLLTNKIQEITKQVSDSHQGVGQGVAQRRPATMQPIPQAKQTQVILNGNQY
jgi:hypothetical protein